MNKTAALIRDSDGTCRWVFSAMPTEDDVKDDDTVRILKRNGDWIDDD